MMNALRKNNRSLPAAILAILAAACLLLASSGIRSEDDDSIAKIHSIKGKVMVKADGEEKWTEAENNMLLYEKDHIKTDLGGSAVVRFKGGHMVKLGSLVTLSITKAVIGGDNTDVALNLDKGKVFSRVQKMSGSTSEFTVRTPTAIAGVRGTEFGVNVSEDQTTTVTLLSGRVEVSGDNFETYILDDNQMITVQPGNEAAAQVVQMPAEVTQEMEAESEELNVVEDEIQEVEEGGDEGSDEEGDEAAGAEGGESEETGAEENDMSDAAEDFDTLDTTEIIEDTIVEETINNTVEQVIMDNDQAVQESQELNDYPMFPPDR